MRRSLMNNKDIKSMVSTIDEIVNKPNEKDIQITEHYLSELFLNTFEKFEELFNIQLTEEQQNIFVKIGITHLADNKKAKQIDLNEEIEKIIEQNTPEDVFLSLLEWAQAAATAAMVGLSLAGSAAQSAAAARNAMPSTASPFDVYGLQRDKSLAQLSGMDQSALVGSEPRPEENNLGEDGARELPPPNHPNYIKALQGRIASGRDLTDLFGRRSSIDPNRIENIILRGKRPRPGEDRRDIKENSEQLNEFITLKKKKKVYKIIFVDKGQKKKGTAVSHKGVMRIISGKQSFKVFDEKNADVTSQFSQKHKKKDEKK